MNLAFVLLLNFSCDAPFIDKNSIHLFRETSDVKCETNLFSRLTFHFSLFTASMLKMPHPRHHHRQFIFHTIID